MSAPDVDVEPLELERCELRAASAFGGVVLEDTADDGLLADLYDAADVQALRDWLTRWLDARAAKEREAGR